MITFEQMTEQDLDEVCRLEQRSFTMPWPRDAYKRALFDEHTRYVVAKAEGRVIGCCGVRDILSEGEITNVMIDEQYRGQGIGYQMLQRLLGIGEEMGICEFFLEVRCSNEPAVRLYRKSGFEVKGVRRGLYERPTEDGFVMRFAVHTADNC